MEDNRFAGLLRTKTIKINGVPVFCRQLVGKDLDLLIQLQRLAGGMANGTLTDQQAINMVSEATNQDGIIALFSKIVSIGTDIPEKYFTFEVLVTAAMAIIQLTMGSYSKAGTDDDGSEAQQTGSQTTQL